MAPSPGGHLHARDAASPVSLWVQRALSLLILVVVTGGVAEFSAEEGMDPDYPAPLCVGFA